MENEQPITMQKITTFFMFDGKAEEAMNFYISLFKVAEIKNIVRYTTEGPGKEGSVMQALFSLEGQEFICIDSPVKHNFTFTPSISLYINCDSEEEIADLYNALSQGGQVFMPLDKYPFSEKFGWVGDKYGVTWQLNWKK